MKHIIEKFMPLGGKHCNTTSMRQIFNFNGIKISEEMLFGLGSGLGCFYGEFNKTPAFGGRCKIGEFEQNIASRLNLRISLNKTTSEKKAYQSLSELIANDTPVMVYVDMPYLKYLNLPENAHFGGHTIVVFGIDEDNGTAWVSDRDAEGFKVTANDDEVPADFHVIFLKALSDARGSKHRPYPAENKWVTFDFQGIKSIDRNMIMTAIHKNCESMLNAPVKTVGIKGIKNFSERASSWKSFDDNKLKWSSFNFYIMISHIGGSGGGAFRRMYGNFLRECGMLIDDHELAGLGNGYYEVGEKWNIIANMFHDVYKTLDRSIFDDISKALRGIYIKESELMGKLYTRSAL